MTPASDQWFSPLAGEKGSRAATGGTTRLAPTSQAPAKGRDELANLLGARRAVLCVLLRLGRCAAFVRAHGRAHGRADIPALARYPLLPELLLA